jgi:hypothetical protein
MNERDTVGPYELAASVFAALGIESSLATGFTLSAGGNASLVLEVRRAVPIAAGEPASHVADRYSMSPTDGNAVALCHSILRAFGIELRRVVGFELVCNAGRHADVQHQPRRRIWRKRRLRTGLALGQP